MSWKTMSSNDRNIKNLVSFIMPEAADGLDKSEEIALLAKHSKPRRTGFKPFKPTESTGFRPRQGDKPKTGSGQHQTQHQKQQQRRSPQRTDQCNYCKKFGHWARDCYKKKNDDEKSSKKPNRSWGRQAKPSSSDTPTKSWNLMARVAMDSIDEEANCSSDSESAKQHACSSGVATPEATYSEWAVDSGCTLHMTYNKDWLFNYKVLELPTPIHLGDGSVIAAVGKGEVHTCIGRMLNVYYVPSVSYNLYSIKSAALNGLKTVFNENGLNIFGDGQQIIEGYYDDGLYKIELYVRTGVSSEKALAVACKEIWHKRLGHVSYGTIDNMVKKNAVEGLKIGDEKEQCKECLEGKCTRTTHPTRTTEKAKKPGHSLHLDTVGPVSMKSLANSTYFVLSKDEYSSYKLVRFIELKSEIADQVKCIINIAEQETGNRCLKIHTDNGTEFVNHNLRLHG